MRGSLPKYQVRLKSKIRRRLAAVVRRRQPSHWLVSRVKVVLLAAMGEGVQKICDALTLDRQVVRRWCKRFVEGGFDALKDRKRSGRPASLDRRVWEKAATLVVQSPAKFGRPFSRWSVRELSLYLRERYGLSVGRSSLSRFFRSLALKPHRVKYWLNPTDPEFDEKAAEICKLYVSPPPKTVVLSIDEKPGVQAISRRHPTRPARPGQLARVEFEYKRHGTRNIFAAFNVRTGHVIVDVTADRKTPQVFRFLDQVLRHYRSGPLIMITDNITTRTGDVAREWLRRHPRVTFVFTPKHGSWLNQVEIWFGILSRKALRNRSFSSVDEIEEAVHTFTVYWNDREAQPFAWTYSGKALVA